MPSHPVSGKRSLAHFFALQRSHQDIDRVAGLDRLDESVLSRPDHRQFAGDLRVCPSSCSSSSERNWRDLALVRDLSDEQFDRKIDDLVNGLCCRSRGLDCVGDLI